MNQRTEWTSQQEIIKGEIRGLKPARDLLNEANSKNVFCPEGAHPDYLYQIRKYLRPVHAEGIKEEILMIDPA